jgi:cytidylate kinase
MSISAKYLVRIEHSVPDFNSWKKAFDNDPVGREKSRVRRYRIMRPVDNPNYAMVDLEFDTSSDAETFRTSILSLWRSAEAKGIIAKPQLRIVESVESKEL